MTNIIPSEVFALIDGPSFAVLATIQPDGRPQQSVVWVKRDGNDILFSTTRGRRKELNLARDHRCSLLINPSDAPYSYLEVRGTVSTTEEGGRALIDELAGKYLGSDRYEWDDGTDNVRVVVRIAPDKVVYLAPQR
jgi:PPOX class probable F420-dependent enzyme